MTIFYCNTYYQLINAIQLSLTEYRSSRKCFLLSGSMKLAGQLAVRLVETGTADHAYVVKDRFDTWRIWMFSTPLKKRYELRIRELFADEEGFACLMQCETYLFANIGGAALCLGEYLHQKRPEVRLAMYEDGVSSYSRIFGDMIQGMLHPSNPAKRAVNSAFGTPYHHLAAYYLFLPELLVWDCPCPVRQIPPVSDTLAELRRILNILFDYASLEETYGEKVIFFEESYYADGVEVDDLSIVDRLAEQYGTEQIMVKLHPRSRENRFAAKGYRTNLNSAIPWEVIALNIPLSDKVLATISSTALLSSYLLSGGAARLLFCYSRIDYEQNLRLKYTVEVIQQLEKLHPESFITLP